ncbi:MAG: LamG domain-containing protein, partial [Candidatus Marinimicrobia bacterium]|nr:LamG domain-containing protein [Candidatus Neomarinimicrobiota bacterium]
MLKYYRNPPDLSGSGKKANLILIFTALTALAIALPQMAFAQGAGKALDFDGVNNYVDCGSGSSLDFDASETYTWEGWFKPDTPTGYGGLIGKVRDGSGGYVVGFNSNNKLYVARHYGPMAFSSALTLNNWYHFAITYNNMAVQIYINGAIDGSGTSTFYDNTVSNLMLGLHDGAHKFNGIIDETRIWDVALSEAEIRDWMCKKVDDTHPQWSHLKGYWRLDESSGASCTDHSGNSNTGTMVNMDPATDRVWSAAAIGDDAAYTTTGSSINLASSGGDDITLQNIGGSPDMVALIRSDESPNYTGVSGLDYVYTSRYWEVWMSGGTSPDYDLVYNYDGYSGLGDEDSLRLGYRADAAVTQWSNSWVNPNTTANTLALRNQTANQQYILGSHSVEYITQGAGKALDFDGTDDYVDCGNDESLDITTGGLTIEAWIKPNQQSVDNDGKIFSKVMLGWSRYSIGTRFSDAEPYPYFALFKVMEAEYYVKANSILTAGQWTHVVGAWDGANYMIYINGELDNKNPFSGPLEPYPGNLTIGSHATDTYFKGTIDEVRIWNVARTEAQIRANMCKKLAGTEDNLVGYWRFDEREGTSCTDHSSNSNTGTMTNMDPATDRVWSTAAFGDEGERKIGSTPNVPTSDNLDLYLNFTNGVGSGAILAAIENNEASVDGTKPTDNISERYWDIQFLNTGGDDTYSATGKFYWSGLGAMGPEKAFRLLSRPSAGENWAEVSSYSIDETNNYFQTTATSFTQFAMGYNDPATFVYPGFPKAKYFLLGVPVIPSNGNPNSVLADDFDNKTAGVDWRLS